MLMSYNIQYYDAARLLDAWEVGRDLSPAGRALSILRWGWPEAAPEDLAGLGIGARDKAILTLYSRHFGATLECLAVCPACGESLELAFDAGEIGGGADLAALVTSGHARPRRFECDGWSLTYRMPSAGDLAAIPPTSSLTEARRTLRDACVVAVVDPCGETVPTADAPASLLSAWNDALSEAEPDSETRLDLTCPSCGHGFEPLFDAIAHAWAAVDVLARRLLREVHRLAGAYGWSESEILALSPVRRRCYLELLG